jgi:hypothetical protein
MPMKQDLTIQFPAENEFRPAVLPPLGLGPVIDMVGHSGLEPETFPLSEECSSRLS